jgi:PKD repeat protein
VVTFIYLGENHFARVGLIRMFKNTAADLGFTNGRIYLGFEGGTGYVDVPPDQEVTCDVQKNAKIVGARLHVYVTPYSFSRSFEYGDYFTYGYRLDLKVDGGGTYPIAEISTVDSMAQFDTQRATPYYTMGTSPVVLRLVVVQLNKLVYKPPWTEPTEFVEENIITSYGITMDPVLDPLPSAPVANFTMVPTGGVFPLTVQFTDTSTGQIDSWAWTFGDGGGSTERNPVHTYTAPGTYTIGLIVTNAGGQGSKLRSVVVTAVPEDPDEPVDPDVAMFGFSEIVENNLPTMIVGYASATCGGAYPYIPPAGYFVYSCESAPMGSHGGCSSCLMCLVTCVQEGGEPEDPEDPEDPGEPSVSTSTNILPFILIGAGLLAYGIYKYAQGNR